MTNTHSYKGIVWLDLVSPTETEIGSLVKRYELHRLVGEELRSSSSLAKIDFYKDYMLIVLTLPSRVKKNGTYEIIDREVDFVIGKNFLITARTDTIEQIEYFSKIFEANSILDKNEKIAHAGYIFYYMVKRIYAGMFQDLENIRDALLVAETNVFNNNERKMVEVLSNLSRELIDFRQTARIHKDIWDEMIRVSELKEAWLGEEFASYMRDVRDEFTRIHEMIANSRELLADLRETNDSLLNSMQNNIIKVLTVVSFVFYPLTFIASVFTIPSAPVDTLSGWFSLMIAMAVLGVGIWWYFRKKHWI